MTASPSEDQTMPELDDIFAEPLATAISVYSSIVILAVYAVAALVLIRRQSRTTRPGSKTIAKPAATVRSRETELAIARAPGADIDQAARADRG
jgi:hypothetical protein